MKRSHKLAALIAVPVLLVGTGGAVAATQTNTFGLGDDAPISGKDRDRAVDAAIKHVGGGTAISTENRDEDSPYEVEVRTERGTTVEVDLDDQFRVIATDADDDDRYDDDGRGDLDDRAEAQLTPADRDRANAAAVKEVGEGTAVDTDISDDGSSYEVEVRKENGATVDVHLDDRFGIIGVDPEDRD